MIWPRAIYVRLLYSDLAYCYFIIKMFEWGVYEIKIYNQVLKNGPYYDV